MKKIEEMKKEKRAIENELNGLGYKNLYEAIVFYQENRPQNFDEVLFERDENKKIIGLLTKVGNENYELSVNEFISLLNDLHDELKLSI